MRPELMNLRDRLAELRKAAGFAQQDLGDEVGVSRRMIPSDDSVPAASFAASANPIRNYA